MMKKEIQQWLVKRVRTVKNDEQLLQAATEFPYDVTSRTLYFEYGWMARYPRYKRAHNLLSTIIMLQMESGR